MFKSVFKSGIRGTYNVSDHASFSTEQWVVYPAKHKQTGKMVSVFIFEKPRFEAQIHRMCSQTTYTRNSRQIVSEFYAQIRAEISNLTKLKHPQILTVLEAMEETKSKFLFATELVTANLVTFNLENETQLSIQKGILEISKGLQFLHDHCSIIHMNIQPSSILINAQGDWRLAGFKFLQNLNDLTPSDRENFYIMNDPSVVEFANHNLNFTAPELIIESSGSHLSYANDIWSLGMLIFYLYNKGDHMINCFETNNLSDFKAEFRKFERRFYNHRPAELKFMLKQTPESLWVIITQLLARYPNDRISIGQFIDSDYFDGSLIKMMWFIDEFPTKTNAEKVVFLDGLLAHRDILQELPSTFKNSKLLSLLVVSIKSEIGVLHTKQLDSETNELLSKSLELIFAIGESLSSLSFQDRIYQGLLNTSKSTKSESPFSKLFPVSVKIRLAIIIKTPVLLKKLQQKQLVDLMKEAATLCVTASKNEIDQQSDQIQLQDTYFTSLPLVTDMFDFPYIKNTLFPLICSVFKTTTVLSTKIQTIKTFEMLIEKKIIDKSIVTDQLFPVLENLKSRDKRIVGAVITFFLRLSTTSHINLDLDIMVDKIISQCFRLIFGCSECSKDEFREMMTILGKIQDTIVQKKLEVLSDSPRVPPKENFSSLINSASIRQKLEEPPIKAPVLSPTSAGLSSEKPKRATLNSHTNMNIKPLTLTPSRQSDLKFGATSSTSGFNTESLVSTLRLDSGSSSCVKQTVGSRNGTTRGLTPNHATSVDWSSAESSLKSPHTLSPGVMKPQYTISQNQGSRASMATSPCVNSVKLPPGFSTDMILTPNSTGPSPPLQFLNKASSDPLDLL